MGEEIIIRQELEGWDYIVKFSEKLHFICLNVLNKKEITDDDYALLKPVFLTWHRGEYLLYENKLGLTPQIVTEAGLFADTLAVDTAQSTDGIEIESTSSEPINDNDE